MQQIVHARFLCGAACSAILVGSLATGQAEAAGASPGCEAVNRGSMNIKASPGGIASRQATLEQGEALTLNLSTQGTAAVTVSTPGGDARTLHSGRASSVLFVAPSTASYGFRLDADGEVGASLAVRCSSVAKTNAEKALIDRRKAFLAGRDPNRIRIDRTPTEAKALDSLTQSETDGALPREVTSSISWSELAAAMDPSKKHEPSILDFWFEGRSTNYDTGNLDTRDSEGNFSVMYFGSQYMLGPDIMLGYLAQFDKAGEASGYGGDVSASGWMTGPYMSVRFGHGIVFDGRAAWGVAENLPNGVMLDNGSAERSLVRGTLRGTRQVGGWTVAPSVGLSYVEDTPTLQGTALTEATPAGTGRLDVLPEVKRRFELKSDAYVEPRVAAGGFLSFDDMSRLGPGGLTTTDPDLHWKAEAGVALGVKDNMNREATGGVETGGEAADNNWLGKLQLNVPLNK